MGTQIPVPKKGAQPPISAHVYCGQTTAWIKMPLGTDVGLGQDDIVLDGYASPLPKKGAKPSPPQFSAHVYCDQTAGWIKMPLGMEVGLSLRDFALDRDPAPPSHKKGHSPLIFGSCLLRPNGCMYQDTTWYGGRPQRQRYCVRWDPAPPPLKGHSPNFRPMSVVAKRLDASRCHLVWG